jgi:hypothetical protein
MGFASVAAVAVLLAWPAEAQRRPLDPATDAPLALFVRVSEVDLGEVSATDQILRPRAVSMVVRAPTRWRLTVRADDDFRGPSPKPVPGERLLLRVGGAPFLPLSRTQAVTLATGKLTGGTGQPVDADLRLDLGWDDAPGLYSATLRLVLTGEP